VLQHAEFTKICLRVGVGFGVLGFVGFFVKMIFIVRFYHARLHSLYLLKAFIATLAPREASPIVCCVLPLPIV
jgi:hypothetical protein